MLCAAAVVSAASVPAFAAVTGSTNSAAEAFGARPAVESPSLSPDGTHLVFIQPGASTVTTAMVMDLSNGDTRPISFANGRPLSLSDCGWSAADRIVCNLYGTTLANAQRVPWSRIVAVDADGKHEMALGRRNDNGLRLSQYDGNVIDWLAGDDGSVIMQRDFVPQMGTGTILQSSSSGRGVERVDTRTGGSHIVQAPNPQAAAFLSDGAGAIRIMILAEQASTDMLTGKIVYKYRLADSHDWRPFSTVDNAGNGLSPIAVDGTLNVAYALQKKDGRNALYRVALDGSMKTELVYADPKVDVDGVIKVGRRGRVIGLTYNTDRRQVRYFDPNYEKLAAQLAKALPNLPIIYFESTSADEQKLLIFAGSDMDPGHYYLLDRTTHKMGEIMPRHPALAQIKLAARKAISFPAGDGTLIPAYLTLPAGSDGKALPGLVMPHGGPAARDDWDFDWLAQYFAERGFAVIQPEFRGSTGYGEEWFANNGFKSWKTAIGDVNDAGRWLVKQGIVAPEKLAIFGWSYGGYAALQSNVVDPDLFKATVAVAPVTDFDMVKEEARGFTNFELVSQEIGNATLAAAGSPDRHASAFRSPVLMFHGDLDLNVNIAQSRAMDTALRHAGKESRLVVYPGLDHQLNDSNARADMLAQADSFLRDTLKIEAVR
jgi:dienelactone hydrolase